METLKIKWQRLISNGETCPRCRSTGEELNKAVAKLEKSLSALGIKVTLEREELSIEEFEKDPVKSNMILINGQPLENWVNGKVGESECCDVCGPADCRTTTVAGKTYEKIPANLIIKAGLIAASNIGSNDTTTSCCDKKTGSSNSSCCC